ncbi:hypothetical protein GCM10022403_017990 [Streptomyces coacervatus]|uniref:Carrier domain-containing protein n=1 Tax=Streptomyces coacervatus TaxID=647381 RepID=A0ABP7H6E9_9ACTN|nr:non-ribosomal peptide synthetase [Streptomyces coacervatus]
MPGLFDRQAALTPEAPALLFQGQTLTYAQLAAQADQLARYLIILGAGPERLVALHMPRSARAVIAMLAVLKAGAAYLPLDPEGPANRTRQVLRNAAPVAVLTTHGAAPGLSAGHVPQVVLDDPDTVLAIEALDGSPLRSAERSGALSERNAAYVLFTSGSTGVPKGVVVPHSGIVNTLRWWQHDHPLTERDRVLLKTPLTFDPSIHEWFWPLWVGALLVVAEDGGHRDTDYLVALIRGAGITSAQFVPTTLREFLAHPNAADCTTLRHVICGGEALPTTTVDRFFSLLRVGLLNVYGPTEASIESTSWACRPGLAQGIAPIGRPVLNSRCYVLDQTLQPVPDGSTGELYIAGSGLARGYLGRADLTAKAFVANPFGEPGERMYRTGDLVFRSPEGDLEFVGRADTQVKIRGVRVELGEIETALCKVTSGHDAAVVQRGDGARQRLIGVVAHPDPSSARALDLRGRLLDLLPSVAVPSDVIFVGGLPEASNGKRDLKAIDALVAAHLAELENDSEPTLPRTELEKRLAAAWQAAFGSGPVGVFDNFFEIGGDSMLAVRLIAEIRSSLGLEVSLRTLFAAPSVARLAEVLASEPPGSST